MKLTTSAGADGYANMTVSWNLSMGDVITGAGVLTTTNKELNKKYVPSIFNLGNNGKDGIDTSNLLKKWQSDSGYNADKRADVKNRMISGSSYDPNKAATIHDFAAKNLSRTGSYTVPHQLPTGTTATNYGEWVYAIGYVEFIDATGNKQTFYTNPVAVSTTDPSHTVEYVYTY